MKNLILVAALLLGANTGAFAGTLGFHLGSYHWPQSNFNNLNLGAYYRTDEGWMVGAYRNSWYKPSVYVARVVRVGPIDVALGGTTGYATTIAPLVVPSYRFENGLRVAFVPKYNLNNAAVHFMWERSL